MKAQCVQEGAASDKQGECVPDHTLHPGQAVGVASGRQPGLGRAGPGAGLSLERLQT